MVELFAFFVFHNFLIYFCNKKKLKGFLVSYKDLSPQHRASGRRVVRERGQW